MYHKPTVIWCIIVFGALNLSLLSWAEEQNTTVTTTVTESKSSEGEVLEPSEQSEPAGRPAPAKRERKLKPKQKRHYVTDHPERSDAGIFYVGFAAGGNFYIEPKVDKTTLQPLGDYWKDFGFQAGVYFDFDYSALDENIPFALRGMGGYKYVLSTAHVFTFDGMVRRMFNLSEKVTMGLGLGGSAALWYRAETDTSREEFIFLPSFLLGVGFEFNPFMVDFKWLINRISEDATILGLELYFGFRL